MAVSNASQIDRPVFWAAPTGSYWDWIRNHILLPNVRDLDAMAIGNPPRDVIEQTTAPIWIQGIEGRYEADWQTWLATFLTPTPQAAPAKKGSRSAKANRTSKKTLSISPGSPPVRRPDIEMAVVLGEAWTGHRRTFPLPDSFVPFYWYELYDRLLPWLARLTLSTQPGADARGSSHPTGVTATDVSRLAPRVIDWIARSQQTDQIATSLLDRIGGTPTPPFVLVVAESSATTQMWHSLLKQWGMPCVVARPTELRIQTTPDVVLLDLDIPPRASFSASNPSGLPAAPEPEPVALEVVTRLRRRFPNAMLAVFDPFPRWQDWRQLQRHGADAIFPKPFSTFGVRWCIRRWIEQGIAGTMDPSGV